MLSTARCQRMSFADTGTRASGAKSDSSVKPSSTTSGAMSPPSAATKRVRAPIDAPETVYAC